MKATLELLEPLLDSWERNNTILVNLLRAVPADMLGTRATESGPSIGQLFTHIHSVRLAFVEGNAPEFACPVPGEEWTESRDVESMARELIESAQVVGAAVRGRLQAGRDMDRHYDHPILFLQHMIWHEGYHHGQVKLALKLAGQPIPDKVAGPLTWGVFLRKRPASG